MSGSDQGRGGPDKDVPTPAEDAVPESRARPLVIRWQGQLTVDAALLAGMSGRLRAGIVMGVRMDRDPSLAAAAVRRILGRLDRTR